MHIAAAVAIALMIFLAYRHGCDAASGVKNGTPPVFSLVERAGRLADLGIKLHANYMLRHSTGYNDALMMPAPTS
jgi:hypothetical protein